MPPVQGDISAALDWLRAWEPAGPWAVIAIEPKTGPDHHPDTTAAVFFPGQEEALSTFIDQYQGIRNL